MRPRRIVAGFALTAALTGALAWRASHPPDSGSFAAAEVQRLRTHFATVTHELLTRDVSDLTPAQSARRAELVRLLLRYSAEARFPRNEHFPGKRVPYFRDAHGTLCAMAYLIESTGSGDLVDRVARTRNNAYLPELADEPGLRKRLDDHGLTLEEAARVQPTYRGRDNTDNVSTAFAVASIGALTVDGVTMVLNFPGVTHSRWPGILGLAASGLTIGLGISKLDDGNGNHTIGVAEVVIGAATGFMGMWSVYGQERREAKTGEASRLTLMPITMRVEERRTFGLAARLSF
jgi:hypothetical protein